MSKILAIDLGTGFSAMSIMEGTEPTIIANSEGNRTTPSIIGFTKGGERLVGQSAKRQAITNPKNTVYSVKRFIGKKYSECKDDIGLVPYEVVEAANGDAHIKIDGKEYSPEELSSFVLSKLKKDAEAFTGETITQAIITVPAYFNDSQRQATKNAGEIAGLEVLRIINEPTAASLAYGLNKNKNGVVAVADVGCGTYDISILDISDGVFEVKATNGDTHLGGDDFDHCIMNWLIEEFKNKEGIDLSKDNMALQRVKEESEKAKCALSTETNYSISLPFISANQDGPKHLNAELSRTKLEQLCADVIAKLEAPAKQCLKDAGVDKVDDVILVGGSTRMPAVQQKIKEIFGIEPSKGVNPDEAVALGAAVQSGVLTGDVKDILLLDVTPLTLSIETMGGIATPMIERNTTIPTKKTQTFSTAVDNQPAITVRIAQGERKMFNDNKVLGSFNLDGIPPAPRGVPQIEITYDIDANGILNVTAKDLGTKKEQHITITASSGLSDEDIEKAKADAEKYAEEDKKRAELVNFKNLADNLAYSSEKNVEDNKDKLTEEQIKSVKDAAEKVREAIKTDDREKIDEAMKELSKVNEPIAKEIYKDAPNGGASSADMNSVKDMFGGANGPFANSATGESSTANSTEDPADKVVD